MTTRAKRTGAGPLRRLVRSWLKAEGSWRSISRNYGEDFAPLAYEAWARSQVYYQCAQELMNALAAPPRTSRKGARRP